MYSKSEKVLLILVKKLCLNISLKSKNSFVIFQEIVLGSVTVSHIKWKPILCGHICFKKNKSTKSNKNKFCSIWLSVLLIYVNYTLIENYIPKKLEKNLSSR